jgi:hypothetical protein
VPTFCLGSLRPPCCGCSIVSLPLSLSPLLSVFPMFCFGLLSCFNQSPQNLLFMTKAVDFQIPSSALSPEIWAHICSCLLYLLSLFLFHLHSCVQYYVQNRPCIPSQAFSFSISYNMPPKNVISFQVATVRNLAMYDPVFLTCN